MPRQEDQKELELARMLLEQNASADDFGPEFEDEDVVHLAELVVARVNRRAAKMRKQMPRRARAEV
jgi:hypothetical protein